MLKISLLSSKDGTKTFFEDFVWLGSVVALRECQAFLYANTKNSTTHAHSNVGPTGLPLGVLAYEEPIRGRFTSGNAVDAVE